MARIVHWKLCVYTVQNELKNEHQPNGVIESDKVKILRDFNIQCDSLIECGRPDIVVVLKKKKECKITDITIPRDIRTGEKEIQKMEKYDDLKGEIKRMWAMRKIEVKPTAIAALGAVSRKLNNWVEKLDILYIYESRISPKDRFAWNSKITERKLGKLKTPEPQATSCCQLLRENQIQPA